MKFNKMSMFFYLVILSILLVACGSESAPATTENTTDTSSTAGTTGDVTDSTYTGGDIRVALNAQPPTLDPHMTTATVTSEVSRHIFEQLLTFDSNYEVSPMLAESYEQSEDRLTTTFYLRQGVLFHNGKEMTSEDVVASMNKWLETSTRAKTALRDATFVAEDDYTVILQLEEPSLGALHTIAQPMQFSAIMPKEVIESASAEGVTEFIGTGPFEFVEWRQDQYIHVQKFEDYQPLETAPDGLAGKREALVDNVYFDVVTDPSTRVAGVLTGQYHAGIWLPRDNYQQLESAPNVKTSLYFNGEHNFVFNKKQGIFTDPLMRQAINAALDKEEIMLASFSDEAFYRLDHGIMYQEQTAWYSEAGKEYYNQNNPERVQELLQEAGYNGETIRILASRDYDQIYNTAVVMQQQLLEQGINADIEVYDWATVVQKRTEPAEYDLFITGFSTVTDPTQILVFDSTWAGWTEDETISELLSKISSSASPKEAKPYFEELQEYNWGTYLSHVKLGDFYNLTGYSENLEGLTTFEGIIVWNTSLK